MPKTIIFRDLPATFPEKDRFQKPSIVSSVVFHVVLLVTLLVLPLMFPQRIEEWRILMMLAPLPPPPAAPPAAVQAASMPKPVAPKVQTTPRVDAGALFSPVSVPSDIARIVDTPVEVTFGVVGGVPGGVPGGVLGGVMGGFLAANARTEMAAPPPPPPPPTIAPALRPKAPIRVGGDVTEPRIVKLVQPVYPPLASLAHVSGTVVLEATLTTEGTVEEIRVVSGHPLLVNAAIDCVKQWRYEPTYLNNEPVSVILTAIVTFTQRQTQ